jgi:hypothetical protein
MPFYKIYPLPMPPGYAEGLVSRINDHGRVIGSALNPPGTFQATLWNATAFSIINVAGTSSAPLAINIKTNIAGQVDGKPFFWKRSSGTTTILKDFNGSPATAGVALALNDHDQITGAIIIGGEPVPAFWNDPLSTPVNLFFKSNLFVFDDLLGYQAEVNKAVGIDIGKDGTIVGDAWGDLGKRQHGFI